MNISEIQELLRESKKSNITLSDIAKAAGTSRGYISKIAAKNTPLGLNKLKMREQYYNVDFNALISTKKEECITIEHIGIKPSCGSGTTVEQEPVIKPIVLGNEVISHYLRCTNPANLKAFTASGDSMSPVIEDGDVLLVDIGRSDINNSGIYVFCSNNEWRVKRFNLKLDGTLEIISDNKRYKKEVLTPNSKVEIKIIGRVIKNMSRGL